MMNDEMAYIPSEFVEGLSCYALGLTAYLIANRDKMFTSFADIAKANRGSGKKLLEIMEELVVKNIAELVQDGMWRVTMPQPDGQIQMMVTQEEMEVV